MHIPFSFREKMEKTMKIDKQEPQNVVPQRVAERAFYHMIRRKSPTLSCNKTLVTNFFFSKR